MTAAQLFFLHLGPAPLVPTCVDSNAIRAARGGNDAGAQAGAAPRQVAGSISRKRMKLLRD